MGILHIKNYIVHIAILRGRDQIFKAFDIHAHAPESELPNVKFVTDLRFQATLDLSGIWTRRRPMT